MTGLRRRPLLQALGTLALPALAAAEPARGPQADLARLQAHQRFLADPLLEGRETGTRGYDLAAAYVASQFAQLGLKPRGDAGGFAQAVPLKTARLAATPPVLELCRGTSCERLAWLDEFSTRPDIALARSEVSAPLVFAGYGISAPAFGLDDYAGLDVKGRIAVVLSGRPPQMPSEQGAHYGNARTKQELAARHGAIGVITLSTPRSEIVAPFHNNRLFADSVSMDWVTPEGHGGSDIPGMQAMASVSVQAAPRLLAALGRDYATLIADAEAGRPLPRGELGLSARLTRDSVHGQARSHNVVGFIEGRHPRLKHEVIVLSAHLDHLGKKGDAVYPGAMDNALGIATLLEVARLQAHSATRPDRSILFVALTAEEKNYLGSVYFARHPPVPATALVANINIDMPILLHDFSTVVALGAQHSTLGAAVERAVRKLGLNTAPDPQPEQSRFTRSDQYSFVRRGIPAVILGPGGSSFDAREDGDALMREFRRLRYHQPGDDLSQSFHWRAVQRFAQLQWELLAEVARQPERPRWQPGDFFGELFGSRR
ncbi:M28 family metallopeptidase [Roseateles asaccharophilus]|uniref:Zn-dependent M28 family amino/carboxypeptidase n=1 Tax=Roseateles asaccharophilus TaxID=582607 RepID=A0ABU2AFQ2_9BURK|nr:M28 family metallopeptidase [Roseateles asaccharophilus]MDR7336038.1 Zn-dependent M28 family amino/carboxypeptidase [Roseateles asaccharophilus]